MSARLRHWLSHLYSDRGFRGPVLTLLSGTGVTLVLAYLAQPVLTRLYSPEAFGLADYFIALAAILASFTSLRYDDALVLPENDEEAGSILWLAFIVLFGFTALFAVLLIWRDAFAALAGLPDLAPWLLLLPPTVLLMRAGRVAEAWLTRLKRYRPISAGQAVGTATTVTTRIGAGFASRSVASGAMISPGGLIGGYTAGQLVGTLVLLGVLVRHSGALLKAAFRPRRMVTLAARYRKFPLYTTPSTLLNNLVGRLPILLLPLYFDEAVVGFFGRAFAVLAIPLSLVGGAVARVFFIHAAEAHREGGLRRLTAIIHRRLILIGLFPTLALMLAGPDIFEVVFGERWREAGIYVQLIGPWLFVAAVASPITVLFDVLEHQRLDFLTSILMFVALTVAMLAGGRTGDVFTTLLYVSLVGTGVRILQLVLLLRLAHVAVAEIARAYGRYLAFSLPGLLLTGGALWTGSPLWITAATVVGGLIYTALILWQDRLLAFRPPSDGSLRD